MSLQIITHPNPILRKKANQVADPTSHEMKDLTKKMTETMAANQGIGLAAPQVGISKRVICIAQTDEPLVLFNPRITKKSFSKNTAEEGCLSVTGVFGPVKRRNRVTVCGQDKDNQKIRINAEGILARVFQHEIDHLDGILFIDKIVKLTKGTPSEE